jgi:hypothetical protein
VHSSEIHCHSVNCRGLTIADRDDEPEMLPEPAPEWCDS